MSTPSIDPREKAYQECYDALLKSIIAVNALVLITNRPQQPLLDASQFIMGCTENGSGTVHVGTKAIGKVMFLETLTYPKDGILYDINLRHTDKKVCRVIARIISITLGIKTKYKTINILPILKK